MCVGIAVRNGSPGFTLLGKNRCLMTEGKHEGLNCNDPCHKMVSSQNIKEIMFNFVMQSSVTIHERVSKISTIS